MEKAGNGKWSEGHPWSEWLVVHGGFVQVDLSQRVQRPLREIFYLI